MVDDQFAAAIEYSHYLLAFLSRRCLVLDEHERAQFKAYAASMAKVQALVAASQDVKSGRPGGLLGQLHLAVVNLRHPGHN